MSRPLLRAAFAAAVAACTVYNRPTVTELARPRRGDSVTVSSPVKAHLVDGSTVVYRAGFRIVRDTVRAPVIGTAFRYGLTLADSAVAGPLPLDSVVGMENFRSSVNSGGTMALNVLGVAAGAALVICASSPKCFGSCPTFYSDSAGAAILEAEGFSYSIAPLFEARDVDRLRAQPEASGDLRLEVRNEALETHYINQLALLEVRHAADELVAPDAAGHPIAYRAPMAPASARDRLGRDVLAAIRGADGIVYRTDSTTIAQASPADLTDFIDLSFPAPRGTDSVALVFRMRNSLLNTVLLYEAMLGDQGAQALDWMGQELQEIGPAVRLGHWYAERMGLRVALRGADGDRQVVRIPDTGPVAWKDVAVPVAVPPGADSLRIRLSFAADDWRIDRIALALGVRRPAVRTLEAAAITDADDRPDTTALASLRTVDQRYLVTAPGQRFTIRFATGRAPGDSARSFLLASEGYYIEWMRAAWLRGGRARPDSLFEPTDDRLVRTLHRWHDERADFERRFYATRVPVR